MKETDLGHQQVYQSRDLESSEDFGHLLSARQRDRRSNSMEQVLKRASAIGAKDGKQLKPEAVERPAPGDQKEDPPNTYASAAAMTKKTKTIED